jgi:hypothetical protein
MPSSRLLAEAGIEPVRPIAAVLRRRRAGRGGVRGAAHRRCPDSTRLRRLMGRMGSRAAYAQVAARQRPTGQWPLAGPQAADPAQRLAAPGLYRGTRGLRKRKGMAPLGEMRRDGRLTCQGLTTLAPRNRPNCVDYTAKPVVRGGVEPPAFRFSGAPKTSPHDARRGLIGDLAAETNDRCRLVWPVVCRCWLPFGSPFGSPETVALRRSHCPAACPDTARSPTASAVFHSREVLCNRRVAGAAADARHCRNEYTEQPGPTGTISSTSRQGARPCRSLPAKLARTCFP